MIESSEKRTLERLVFGFPAETSLEAMATRFAKALSAVPPAPGAAVVQLDELLDPDLSTMRNIFPWLASELNALCLSGDPALCDYVVRFFGRRRGPGPKRMRVRNALPGLRVRLALVDGCAFAAEDDLFVEHLPLLVAAGWRVKLLDNTSFSILYGDAPEGDAGRNHV
jgi:hypothetical protein